MFTCRDVRRGMEVYARDGRSLGVVLRVGCRATNGAGAIATTYPASASAPNGEAMGPAPTAALGNSGPAVQSAPGGYAVAPNVEGGERSLDRFLVGRWFGLLGRRWVGAERIVNVSLERILVDSKG